MNEHSKVITGPMVVTGFHGTTAGNFDAFIPRIRPSEQLGFGMHFSAEREIALLYATDPMIARRGKSPYLYEVSLTLKKPLTAAAIVVEGTPEFALAIKLGGKRVYIGKDEGGNRCAWLQNAIDATTPRRAQGIIEEAGYDGILYNIRIGTPGVQARITHEGKGFVVFSPDQIQIISRQDLSAAATRIQKPYPSQIGDPNAAMAKQIIANFTEGQSAETGRKKRSPG